MSLALGGDITIKETPVIFLLSLLLLLLSLLLLLLSQLLL